LAVTDADAYRRTAEALSAQLSAAESRAERLEEQLAEQEQTAAEVIRHYVRALDLGGLIREFEDGVKRWREIMTLAEERDDSELARVASARAETWQSATDMARRWESALADEETAAP
jgi:hypothetical protein